MWRSRRYCYLAFLPNYIASDPPSDFIACSDVTNIAGAGC